MLRRSETQLFVAAHDLDCADPFSAQEVLTRLDPARGLLARNDPPRGEVPALSDEVWQVFAVESLSQTLVAYSDILALRDERSGLPIELGPEAQTMSAHENAVEPIMCDHPRATAQTSHPIGERTVGYRDADL